MSSFVFCVSMVTKGPQPRISLVQQNKMGHVPLPAEFLPLESFPIYCCKSQEWGRRWPWVGFIRKWRTVFLEKSNSYFLVCAHVILLIVVVKKTHF